MSPATATDRRRLIVIDDQAHEIIARCATAEHAQRLYDQLCDKFPEDDFDLYTAGMMSGLKMSQRRWFN